MVLLLLFANVPSRRIQQVAGAAGEVQGQKKGIFIVF